MIMILQSALLLVLTSSLPKESESFSVPTRLAFTKTRTPTSSTRSGTTRLFATPQTELSTDLFLRELANYASTTADNIIMPTAASNHVDGGADGYLHGLTTFVESAVPVMDLDEDHILNLHFVDTASTINTNVRQQFESEDLSNVPFEQIQSELSSFMKEVINNNVGGETLNVQQQAAVVADLASTAVGTSEAATAAAASTMMMASNAEGISTSTSTSTAPYQVQQQAQQQTMMNTVAMNPEQVVQQQPSPPSIENMIHDTMIQQQSQPQQLVADASGTTTSAVVADKAPVETVSQTVSNMVASASSSNAVPVVPETTTATTTTTTVANAATAPQITDQAVSQQQPVMSATTTTTMASSSSSSPPVIGQEQVPPPTITMGNTDAITDQVVNQQQEAMASTTATTAQPDIGSTWGQVYDNNDIGVVGGKTAGEVADELINKLTDQVLPSISEKAQSAYVNFDHIIHDGVNTEELVHNVQVASTKAGQDATKFAETFAERFSAKATEAAISTGHNIQTSVTQTIPNAIKDYSTQKLNTWGSATDEVVTKEAYKIGSTVSTVESKVVEQSTSTIENLEHAKLSELGDIIGKGLEFVGSILYQALDAIVMTFSGDSIAHHVAGAQASINNVVGGAINSITSTMDEISHKTVADAAQSFVALVVAVVKILFKIMSWIVLQLSGNDIPGWITEATTNMQLASQNLINSISSFGNELSQKSLQEIGTMVSYFLEEVGRFIVEVFQSLIELGTATAGMENVIADNAATIDGMTSTVITAAMNHL